MLKPRVSLGCRMRDSLWSVQAADGDPRGRPCGDVTESAGEGTRDRTCSFGGGPATNNQGAWEALRAGNMVLGVQGVQPMGRDGSRRPGADHLFTNQRGAVEIVWQATGVERAGDAPRFPGKLGVYPKLGGGGGDTQDSSVQSHIP